MNDEELVFFYFPFLVSEEFKAHRDFGTVLICVYCLFLHAPY